MTSSDRATAATRALPDHHEGCSRVQELWPDWWREAEIERQVERFRELLVVEGPSRLDGKERRNLLRAAVEAGIVIGIERGPNYPEADLEA